MGITVFNCVPMLATPSSKRLLQTNVTQTSLVKLRESQNKIINMNVRKNFIGKVSRQGCREVREGERLREVTMRHTRV